jgi:putative oxidoreductase
MSFVSSINRTVNILADNTQTLSWTIFRVLSSAMFMTHGWPKMFGDRAQPFLGGMGFFGVDAGINMLWIAGALELFGGALLVLGLFTRYIAALAAILMVMAYLAAHPAWFPTLNNGELATMYFLTYFVIFAFGPGKISVDAMLRGRA